MKSPKDTNLSDYWSVCLKQKHVSQTLVLWTPSNFTEYIYIYIYIYTENHKKGGRTKCDHNFGKS